MKKKAKPYFEIGFKTSEKMPSRQMRQHWFCFRSRQKERERERLCDAQLTKITHLMRSHIQIFIEIETKHTAYKGSTDYKRTLVQIHIHFNCFGIPFPFEIITFSEGIPNIYHFQWNVFHLENIAENGKW